VGRCAADVSSLIWQGQIVRHSALFGVLLYGDHDDAA